MTALETLKETLDTQLKPFLSSIYRIKETAPPVMKKLYVIASLVLAVSLLTMCNKASLFSEDGFDDRLSGGAATVFDRNVESIYPFSRRAE